VSTWQGIAGPVKRFSGTSGSITIPKGSMILHFVFQGGTCTGVPDGVGGSLTLTSPSNAPFYYDPMHLACVTPSDLLITFGGTTMYFVEIQNKVGF
jgi:hypothetical protein